MILREDYADKDSQFHAQIANCSHNLVMTNLVPVITDGVRVFAGAVRKQSMNRRLNPIAGYLRLSGTGSLWRRSRLCISP